MQALSAPGDAVGVLAAQVSPNFMAETEWIYRSLFNAHQLCFISLLESHPPR